MLNLHKKIGIGIDLGTTTLLVFVENQGIVYNEASVIAFDRYTGRVIAAGDKAYDMLGKCNERVTVIKPFKDGAVTDMRAAKALLTYVFSKLDYLSAKDLGRVTTLICCPSEMTKYERDTMVDLAISMGMGDTHVVEEIKAAAVGSGIDVYSSTGSMIVDIGGGTTDVGVLSSGDILFSRNMAFAGNYMDELIIRYIRDTHSVEVGEKTAERIKNTLATLDENKPEITERFAGRCLVRGLPKWITITNQEVRQVITPAFEQISLLVQSLISELPQVVHSEILRHGITLCGGCSLIHGVKDFMSDRIKLPVELASNPTTCVAEGTRILLEESKLEY